MATADRWPMAMAMTMTMTIPTISPPSYYGVDGDMAKTPILCSSSKSSNGREWGRRRRGVVIFTTSTPIAEAAVEESKCRCRRRLSSTLTSWWWWVVAATTILASTHLPPSIATAALHFHPARSSRSNSHRRTILNSLAQSPPSPTTATLSFAQPPPQILSDPYRIRRRRQRLSSLALFAIQTSTTSDSSSGISIVDAISDNTTLNDNQLLLSSQQKILLPLQQLRHLQKYKTNKDIETAIVRLGRKGRTNEALQLYHAVWKLDELRQQQREDEREAKGQPKQQQQQLSQKLPPQQLSQELIQLINKSKLRPTTRLMNSAIDACARSSFSHHHHHHHKSTTESSTVLPPVAAIAQLPPRSRTRIALDIFHSGTSIWWESDDDETPNTPFSSSSSSASSDAMASFDATKKKRKKKHGGALSPNVYTFGALLACCARDGDISTSLELLSILEEGTQYPDVELNDVIYSTVISACANANITNNTISNDDLGGRSGSSGSSIPNNVKVALDVLNRGIAKLYQRGDGRDNIYFDNDVGSSSSSTTTTTAKATTAGMMKMMGVVGYNAAISTMSRAGEWKLAVQLLGEMILYSSTSAAAADTTTTPSSSSTTTTTTTTTTTSSPLSTSLLLQRTNPNFAPMEMLRDDMNCRQLLLLPHHANINSTSSERTRIHHDHDTKKDGVIVPKPDEVTFGTVLAACERSGEWEILLNVAKAAKEYGVKLDGMALTSVLHSCQQLGLADEALEYLELMKHLGDDDENVDCDATTTITGKGVSRSQQQQQQQATSRTTNGRHRKGAKQALRGPDGVAYRLAISACARAPGGQRWQDGIRLLREMKDVAMARKVADEEMSSMSSSSSSSSTNNSTLSGTDCAPDVMAYTAAIAGCSEAGEYIHAISLISEMRREGIQPNVVTFSAVINACATASAKLARSRREDEESTTGSSTSSGGSRFMYESFAGLESVRLPMNRALRLLEAMKSPTSSVRPNIVTYNAAIRACAEGFNLDGAFDLLRQLKEDGMEPTIVTYGSLMTACERVGDIEAASRVFRMVKEEGKKNKDNHVDVDSHSSSGKNGSHEQIIQVNEIIYGAAISCCRKAQQPERALFLLRKMMDEKLAPNTATFNTVIAALAEHQGNNNNNNNNSRDIVDATTKNNNNNSYDSTLLLEKALAVYRVMKSKHAPPGGQPNRKTYNILIRCLSSNLQPGYAESLLLDMRNDGFVPDVDLYTMTVRSYEKCGNPMKALGLMERMREMGYDFYKMKVLDDAFKSGVKILNRMGKGFSSTDGSSRVGGGDTGFNTDGVDGRGALYALSEESIAFDDYD